MDGRRDLHWRNDADPVTGLLRHGLLVEDGEGHDQLRKQIMPALHRKQVESYIEKMWRRTDQITGSWQAGKTYDMLVEMRRLALLIVMDTLFDVDITPDLERLLPSILDVLKFISPGLWLLGIPRRNYDKSIATINAYMERLIRQRRSRPAARENLLDEMIAGGMDDGLIRDQMLTLLIAGHDTSTALLAWTLYLVGKHPEVQGRLFFESQALPLETPASAEQVELAGLFRAGDQ